MLKGRRAGGRQAWAGTPPCRRPHSTGAATLVVRSLLVPALVIDIGPRACWPSALAGRDG
ncbi:hypothetical protein ACFWJT_05365 [Streptomyces sp. NPDC127069]|uniref:hypothetical protein n=1 Tax=Streptomyces sp. NPDC127069 TaxID=3347128 RepID=UPI003648D949